LPSPPFGTLRTCRPTLRLGEGADGAARRVGAAQRPLPTGGRRVAEAGTLKPFATAAGVVYDAYIVEIPLLTAIGGTLDRDQLLPLAGE